MAHRVTSTLLLAGVFLADIVGGRTLVAADAETWDGRIVQYGKMREAIGRQQHQARVQLKKLAERPHFYGVAALAKLEGEATILDGNVTVTRVDAHGRPQSSEAAPLEASATLLAGAYVPSWSEHKVAKGVSPDEFDEYIADAAAISGVNESKPFVFTVQGKFSDVRLHVIHGACPVHARLHKIPLPQEKRPFEAELERVQGTIVGVFANDSVGNLTHPDASTHVHLVYQDAQTGKTVTGHVEQIGLLEGAILRLPKTK